MKNKVVDSNDKPQSIPHVKQNLDEWVDFEQGEETNYQIEESNIYHTNPQKYTHTTLNRYYSHLSSTDQDDCEYSSTHNAGYNSESDISGSCGDVESTTADSISGRSNHISQRLGKALLASMPLSLIARMMSKEKMKKSKAKHKALASNVDSLKQQATSDDSSIEYQLIILLITLGLVFGSQNLIAPNMTVIAQFFNFNQAQRDQFIGGELTFLFYTPGSLGAIIVSFLSYYVSHKRLFSIVITLTAVSSLLTWFVVNFSQLAILRTITGLCIGGIVPISYSLVGQWFPPWKRASASAFLMGACGIGTFAGQFIAAALGVIDWRLPFLVISLPAIFMGVMFCYLVTSRFELGSNHSGGWKQFKYLVNIPTNIIMMVQGFPGNIPWGVLTVYFHDFMRTDLGMSNSMALAALSIIGVFSFCGMIIGGFVGEIFYRRNKQSLCIMCAITNFFRILPFVILLNYSQSHFANEGGFTFSFILCLIIGGLLSTFATPNVGAIILNVNTPEDRCSIFGILTVLDDFSKAFGSLFASYLISNLASRRVAFQVIMSIWLISAITMFLATWTFPKDEEKAMKMSQKSISNNEGFPIIDYSEKISMCDGRPMRSVFARANFDSDSEFGLSNRSLSRL